MSKHPEVLWAQRSSNTASEKNIIYLTVNLPDIDQSSLKYTLTSTGLSFDAVAGTSQTQYAFNLELFAEVNPEKSTHRLTSRSFVAVLLKKELKSDYWPRLTKEKIKTPFIKTDFSKWVDEDEQDGNPSNLDDDFGDFGGVGGIPGMDMDLDKMMAQSGSSGGDPTVGADEDDDDSDDSGLPPLEDGEPSK